jgi:phosphatidylserine decarboxylase
MLFEEGAIKFNPAWAPERPVRLGEAMGNRREERFRGPAG